MIICPVCEYQQAQGDECGNCGKKLTAAPAVAVAVAPLPELEQTQVAGGRAPVSVAAMPELEGTRIQSPLNVVAQAMPDLDTGRFAPTQVAAAAVQDLDTGRAEQVGARTAAPTVLVCRYCRNTQASGLLCERCGMKLPKMQQAAAVAPKAQAAASGDWAECPMCHTPGRAGRSCATCGTSIPAAN